MRGSGSLDLRLAAIVAPGIFLLGAVAGHIYETLMVRNFAPGNAGIILYTDILIPLFGLSLLILQYLQRPSRRPPIA